MPDIIHLDAQVEIQAATDAKKVPSVTMTAYNGALMTVPNYGRVAIDLTGLEIPPQIPFLVDHATALAGVVGFGQANVSGGKLLASGTLPPTTEAARQIVEMSKGGFRFGASVGVQIEKREYVPAGQSVTVNGQNITYADGGFTLVRAGRLREISIVALAADGDTSVSIAASLKGKSIMNENENVSPVQQLREDAAAESRRISGILKATADGNLDLQAQAIAEGWDVPATELAVLKAELGKGPNFHVRHSANTLGGSSDDVLRAAACLHLAGDAVTERAYGEKVAESGRRLGVRSVLGLVEASARLAGDVVPHTTADLLKAGFSTYSLPGILGDSANKILLDVYRQLPSVAKQVSKKLSTSDFKTATGYRLDSTLTFEAVPNTGEISHGTLGQSSYTFKLGTYAKMLQISRQDIINDDLGAFAQLPTLLARGAALALESTWATLLLSNPSSFFGTGNDNYLSGAGNVLAATGLTNALTLLRQQVDAAGVPVMVSPKYLLVPPELEVTGRELMNSAVTVATGTTDLVIPAANGLQGLAEPVVSPFLSAAAYSGYSATAWYLLADPNDCPVMGVAYLDNKEMPTIETGNADFNVLGMQIRGYHDFAVCMVDHHGGVKSAGA